MSTTKAVHYEGAEREGRFLVGCGHGRTAETHMNLAAYLKANKAQHEFIEKSATHHADEASRASGIPIANIAKTIVFIDPEEHPVIGVVRGDRMVSRHKLEACSGLHKLRIAPDEYAEKVTGYPTGGIPPVGHRRRLPVYIDPVVAAAHVPSDIVVPISVNKGSPVVLSAPKSGVARAFEQLASTFIDGEIASESSNGGFRKFFG